MENFLLPLDDYTIFLFRHGMTDANEKRLFYGKTDVPVSKKGEESLLQKKQNLFYPDLSGIKIVTSGMKRTTQSLGILYPELAEKAEENPDFAEVDFGDFEMKSYEELKTNGSYQKWVENMVDRTPDAWDFPCPNGESFSQMNNRSLKSLKNLMTNYHSFAIFTHGGVISSIMWHFFPTERTFFYEWAPDFGSGYKISIQEKGKLLSFSPVP